MKDAEIGSWRWAYSGHWQLVYHGLPSRFPWPVNQPEPVFSREAEFPVALVYEGVAAYLEDYAVDEKDPRFVNFSRHLSLGESLAEAFETRDFDAAEKILLEMRGGLDTAYLLHNASYLYEQTARSAKAREALKRAMTLCPEAEMLWHAYGGLCLEAGLHDEAARAYRQCLRLVPDHASATLALKELAIPATS